MVKEDNPQFVLKSECDAGMSQIRLALFGPDLRGGMVKDIQEMKTKLDTATSIVRTIVIPIIVPLVLAGIGYLIGKFGGL